MHYTWSLTLTLEIVKAFGPPLVAGVVGYVAWRQWRTAQDKLAIDLFDRRFAAYRAVLNASEDRQNEIRLTKPLALFQPQPDDHVQALKSYWRASSDATFLFGPDVLAAMRRIDEALAIESAKQVLMLENGPLAYDAYATANRATRQATSDFIVIARPYMMMGRIAVNQPAKPFRWPWQKADPAT